MTVRTQLWLIGALLAAVLVLALYWWVRHEAIKSVAPKIEAAQDQGVTSALEAQGARQTATRVDLVISQREAATASVARFSEEAASAADSHATLDPDRAVRLRRNDGELCALDATLAGCAPAH